MIELNEVKLRQANRVRWCNRLSAVTTLAKRGEIKKLKVELSLALTCNVQLEVGG